MIGARSAARSPAQRAITRNQSSGSPALFQRTPSGLSVHSVRRKLSVVLSHVASLSLRFARRFCAISAQRGTHPLRRCRRNLEGARRGPDQGREQSPRRPDRNEQRHESSVLPRRPLPARPGRRAHKHLRHLRPGDENELRDVSAHRHASTLRRRRRDLLAARVCKLCYSELFRSHRTG